VLHPISHRFLQSILTTLRNRKIFWISEVLHRLSPKRSQQIMVNNSFSTQMISCFHLEGNNLRNTMVVDLTMKKPSLMVSKRVLLSWVTDHSKMYPDPSHLLQAINIKLRQTCKQRRETTRQIIYPLPIWRTIEASFKGTYSIHSSTRLILTPLRMRSIKK
jgi:hypothetical protein